MEQDKLLTEQEAKEKMFGIINKLFENNIWALKVRQGSYKYLIMIDLDVYNYFHPEEFSLLAELGFKYDSEYLFLNINYKKSGDENDK